MTCRHFGVSEKDVKAKTRKREFVVPRHAAMKLLKENTNMSLKYIGQSIGGRDHSSVIHALGAMEDLISTDKDFKKYFQQLSDSVKCETGKLPDTIIYMWEGKPAPIVTNKTGAAGESQPLFI